VNAATSRLVSGVYDVLLERLATNNALQANDQQLRQQIDARRQSAESAIAAALPVVLAYEFSGKAALQQKLEAARRQAAALREQADRALAQPKSQRDGELLKAYVPGMTGYINALLDVWGAAVNAATTGDSATTRYARARRLGWILREISGLERALIATAIAGNKPLPPEALTQITGYRAQVALAWKLVLDLLGDQAEPADVKQALSGAREKYFAGFEPLADRMRGLSQQGAAYPMTAAEWVSTTNPQIDSLLEIMHAAGRASEQVTARITAEAGRSLIVAMVGLLFGLAVTAACFVIVVRRVTAPLSRISGTVRALAAGELDVAVVDAGRRDEIGEVARAIEVFRENAVERRRLEAEQQQRERSAAEERRQAMRALADKFEATAGDIIKTVSAASTELETSATALTKTADTTQRLSTTVAAASEEASTNVQSVASATEEMMASITEIGRQVQASNQIATEAVSQAQRTDDRITKLAQAASRIGDVTQLITSIAEQTNLLALNATIEAARAGEAGKGFAVVAQEVKALASQTGKATNEISTQIAEMQAATQESVAAIKEIGGTIKRISEIATTIASAIEEQGAATQEISRNVQQAAAGTNQVAANITNVNRGAAETGSASAQVLSSARSLADESGRLKTEVDGFLATVRAA
jgi:methyl-accepting chemotaxis protein